MIVATLKVLTKLFYLVIALFTCTCIWVNETCKMGAYRCGATWSCATMERTTLTTNY